MENYDTTRIITLGLCYRPNRPEVWPILEQLVSIHGVTIGSEPIAYRWKELTNNTEL